MDDNEDNLDAGDALPGECPQCRGMVIIDTDGTGKRYWAYCDRCYACYCSNCRTPKKVLEQWKERYAGSSST